MVDKPFFEAVLASGFYLNLFIKSQNRIPKNFSKLFDYNVPTENGFLNQDDEIGVGAWSANVRWLWLMNIDSAFADVSIKKV